MIVPCIGTVTLPLPTGPPPWPAAAAGPGGRPPGRPAGATDDRRGDLGHPEPDLEAAAVDLDVDVALRPGRLALAAARPAGSAAGLGGPAPERSSRSSTHLVECGPR